MIQNLLINATHAMPGGGTVTIRISNRQLKEGEVPPLTEGRYLEMTVSDQGGGIAPDILPHIFDPFFTTKPKGTGLGLATAYSIVKKHGGTLTVHATSSQGTNFMVRIPASEEIRPKAAEPAKAVEHAPASRGIAILLVDDEAIIRSMGKRLLGCLGHTVTTAASGDEAVRLYRERMESGSGFDVVIIDLTMPGMGGNETMQQLRTIDQAVVGVVSSGYSDDEIMARYEEFGFKGVIAKPYSLSEIGKVIRALTGNGRGE
jgi:CheY-like chemotaxis protein